MKPLLRLLDRALGHLGRWQIQALALVGVIVIGTIDYLDGYEVAFSIFYLGPVAVAAWYAGRRDAALVSLASCAGWYAADVLAGHDYSHPSIALWNAFVRLSFFLITSLLLVALRESLAAQVRLAGTDPLTGLFSRRALIERLNHDLALARRRNTPTSIAFIDLDDFKSVNDRRGHAEGDRVLALVGRALKSSVRASDTAARLGGDEFALLLPDTDGEGARRVAAKVHAALNSATDDEPCAAGCSVGVVTLLKPPATAEDALGAADALMYEVKRRGKRAVAWRVIDGAEPALGAIAKRERVAHPREPA